MVGFLWGAIAATTLLALTANTALLALWSKWFGTSWASDWAPGVTAPFTEETAKAIGFILLLGWAPVLFRSVFDGFVVGAFIGLGFEVVEDVLYVFQSAQKNFGGDQVSMSLRTGVLRAFTGSVSHALFTAFVCTGIMWILGRDPRGRHVVKGILLILFAMVVHSGWDNTGALGVLITGNAAGFSLISALLLILGIVAVVLLGSNSARSERVWARAILAPEVDAGVISAAELDALSGTHRDRRHYVKSMHGHHEHRVAKHVLEAGRDLCTALGRGGGADTDDVLHARAELARLRTA